MTPADALIIELRRCLAGFIVREVRAGLLTREEEEASVNVLAMEPVDAINAYYAAIAAGIAEERAIQVETNRRLAMELEHLKKLHPTLNMETNTNG